MAASDEVSAHPVPGPVGFLELLRHSLRIYRISFGPTLRVFFPLYLGYWAATTAILLPYLDERDVPDAVSGGLVALFLIGLPVVFVLSAAWGSRFMSARLVGATTPRLGEAVGGTQKLLVLVPVIAMLQVFFSFFGALSAAIGFLLGPPILVQALVFEELDVRGAWTRTKELLAGNALRVFVYLITASLAVSLIRAGVVVPLAYWLDPKEDFVDVDDMMIGLVEMAVNTLTLPLLVAAGLVLYLDLRHRHDNLTFEQFGEEISGSTSSSPD